MRFGYPMAVLVLVLSVVLVLIAWNQLRQRELGLAEEQFRGRAGQQTALVQQQLISQTALDASRAEVNALAHLTFRAPCELTLTTSLQPCFQCAAAIRMARSGLGNPTAIPRPGNGAMSFRNDTCSINQPMPAPRIGQTGQKYQGQRVHADSLVPAKGTRREHHHFAEEE